MTTFVWGKRLDSYPINGKAIFKPQYIGIEPIHGFRREKIRLTMGDEKINDITSLELTPHKIKQLIALLTPYTK